MAAPMADTNASKIQWKRPRCRASNGDPTNIPRARSGHTLSVIGNTGFLFGGLSNGSVSEKVAQPLDELHILRMGKSELEWCMLQLPVGARPLARWRHSACVFDGSQIIIFGGYHTASLRLSDVWLFNTVAMEWQQPHPSQGSGFIANGSHPLSSSWPGVLPSLCLLRRTNIRSSRTSRRTFGDFHRAVDVRLRWLWWTRLLSRVQLNNYVSLLI